MSGNSKDFGDNIVDGLCGLSNEQLSLFLEKIVEEYSNRMVGEHRHGALSEVRIDLEVLVGEKARMVEKRVSVNRLGDCLTKGVTKTAASYYQGC